MINDIKNFIISYFDKYNIDHKTKNYTKNDKTINQRVKKYRLNQSEKGLKTICCYLSVKNHSKLKKIASRQNMSYSEIISDFLQKIQI